MAEWYVKKNVIMPYRIELWQARESSGQKRIEVVGKCFKREKLAKLRFSFNKKKKYMEN